MKTLFKKIICKILEWEASILLRRHKPSVIAVAGSVGKTSTKDAIYSALTPFASVRKSDKSFNSEIGIPLTILGLPNAWNNPFKWLMVISKGLFYSVMIKEYPKYLVLEVGSDRPGDIERAVKWLPVSIAVLTRFPDTPVHVEFFKDGHAVNEEDKKILKALKKDGIIIMNADDEEMQDIPSRFSQKIISYGLAQNANVRVEDIKITYIDSIEESISKTPTGMQCTALIEDKSIPLSVAGSVGNQHIYPLLAALAVVEALGWESNVAVPVLIGHESPKGRMRIISGINNSIIIDDTYNSSPIAVEEALNSLAMIESTGKKFAVLGDMLELGIYTEREHIRLGKKAADIVDELIAVGLRAQDFVAGAIQAGTNKNHTHTFAESVAAITYLKKHIQEGDVILVKGSQGMRMERIVKSLMAHPDKAHDLLVRQEKEWEGR